MTRRELGYSCIAATLLNAACAKRPKDEEEGRDGSSPREGLGGRDELQIDYSIVLDDGGSGRHVNDKFHFRSGDRFQIQLRPAFPAYVYVLNRGERQSHYIFLWPGDQGRNPIPAGRVVTLPGGRTWLNMDEHPGLEFLTLIASPIAIGDLETPEQKIRRDEAEQRLALVERDFRPTSFRRFEDKDWVKLFAARGARTAFYLRLPLDHR